MSIKKKEKERIIPKQNYLYLSIIIIGSILFLVYIYKWYQTYNKNKLNTSIMTNYLTIINYNELDNYIIENKDAVIYVSILGDEKINRFEKSFKHSITTNNLKEKILYLDLTNENISTATKKLKIDAEFPYLVVYTNGQITDTYKINKNNYNTKKIEKYLNRIGVTEDD